jgi:hypothetical protein
MRMSDTPPAVTEMYERRLRALSPGQRLAMACRMFHTARVLLAAGCAEARVDERAWRRALLVRLYGAELGEPMLPRIAERWRR